LSIQALSISNHRPDVEHFIEYNMTILNAFIFKRHILSFQFDFLNYQCVVNQPYNQQWANDRMNFEKVSIGKG